MSNLSIINDTCKDIGIERVNPDNINLNDEKVWKSIRDDTSLIFQWNSPYGQQTLKKLFSDDVVRKIRSAYPNITYLDLFSFGNALIRPCGKGQYESAIQGIITPTGVDDIDNLLAPELNRCLYQEDIMQFVMQFCGYSFLEADKLRKIIGKKLGTRQALPSVENGFNANAKVKYGLSDAKAKEIIDPILQGILDASRYSFSKNHAYAYSCIGYECGYLRYYYPVDYIASCLNSFIDDEEKTNEAVLYARKKNIKILPPKFRHARAKYIADAKEKKIYKGMQSIKYINASLPEELYALKDIHYDSFIDLLNDLFIYTSINARQLDILIKIDFFEEFGNSKTLLRMVNLFEFFKRGNAKSIKKETIEKNAVLNGIVKTHSTGLTKAGKPAKSYSNLDCPAILKEYSEYLLNSNIKDFSYKEKAIFQNENFGYIGILTEKTEDRPKLIVLSKKDLISKKSGKRWAVQIDAQSIGSGIKNSFTIMSRDYKEPVNEYDIIYCNNVKKEKGYWHITNYYRMLGV